MAVIPTDIGRRGEDLALAYLVQRGCRLLERNYRANRREIDLIVMDGETLVFVEVKARSRTDFGAPCEAVDRRKQRNLILAAQTYLLIHQLSDVPVRFDVLEVYLHTGKVRAIENAFGL